MTYTLTLDDEIEPRLSRTKLQARVFGALVGFSTIAAALITTSDLGQMILRPASPLVTAQAPVETAPPTATKPPAATQAPAEAPVAMRPLAMPRLSDIGNFPSSGAISAARGWMFAPPAAPAQEPVETAALEEPPQEEALFPGEMPEVVKIAPLPLANPRLAARAPAPEVGDEAGGAPLPAKRPVVRVDRQDRGSERQMASLPANPPIDDEPPIKGDVTLPGPGDRYAVYDITAKTVYMPSGERLEAHSGYGAMFDDPRHVAKKMRGPTPPNTYNLTMREALFHGVEAIRMNPVDQRKMYGRDGILAHSYMLGPRGDSNGCVSFRDYPRFLAAFKRGEVKQIVVVARLPKSQSPANPLLSWLTPR